MAIKAKISVDNSELKQGLQDAQNTAKSTMKNIKGITENAGGAFTKIGNAATSAANAVKGGFSGVVSTLSKIGPVGAVAAGAIALIGTAIFGVFNAISKLSTKLDSIAKSAKSVDMSAGAFQSLSYAAKRAGVSMDRVVSMTTKLDAALHKAVEGDTELVDMFHEMGLSVKELERQSPDKTFLDVTDAAKKFLDTTGKLPDKLRDIFGNKDFREFTKAAKANFSELALMANAMGYVIDENTLRTAENISDAVGDVNQGLLTMITRLELIQKLFGLTEKTAKLIANAVAPKNGRVLPEYADRIEGIGNLAERYATTDADKLTRQQMINILKARNEDTLYKGDYTESGLSYLISKNAYSKKLENMTDEALRAAFKDTFKDTNWDEVFNGESGFKKALFKVVEEQTEGAFKAADPNKWGRLIPKPPMTEEEKQAEKMQIMGDKYNKEIEKSIKYYSDMLNKTGQLYDAEKIILNLEKEYNSVLNDEQKAILRSNAELLKRKALMVELNKLDEITDNEKTRYWVDNISKGGGLPKETLEMLFNSVKGATGKTTEQYMTEVFKGALRYKGIDENFNSINELSKENYVKAFEQILNMLNDGILNVLYGNLDNEVMKQVARYNAISKHVGVKKLSFDMKKWMEVSNETFDDFMKEKIDQINELRDAIQNSTSFTDSGKKTLFEDLKDFEKTFNNFFKISAIIDKVTENNAFFTLRNMRETNNKFDDRAKMDALELDLLNAEIDKDQEAVDLIQKKIMLEKEGIKATQKNLELYDETLQKMIDINKAKGSSKLTDNLLQKAEEAQIKLLENRGKIEEANRRRAVASAEKVKGSALNSSEYDVVTRLSDIVTRISETNIPNQIDDIIHTNELASKGGFASSVVVEKRDNSTQILTVVEKIREQENDILGIIRNINNNKL